MISKLFTSKKLLIIFFVLPWRILGLPGALWFWNGSSSEMEIFFLKCKCLKLSLFVKCLISKQWPLNSEFIEFEYSPKWPFSEMCRTRQTRQHLPAWFALTHQTRRHLPTCFGWTHQTCKSQVLQVLGEFGESGEFGKFSECRLDRFIHIKHNICA